jgi:hypothetical protein
MSIYDAIAAGGNPGAGINAFAQNRYMVQQDQQARQDYQNENAFAKQRDDMAIKQDALRQAAQMYAVDPEAAYQFLDYTSDQYGFERADRAQLDPILSGMAKGMPTSMPEPPKSRTIKSGDSVRTEEWDGQSWRTVGEAPRWNPNSGPAQFNITVNGDEKAPLTSTNESKTQVKVLDAQKSLRDLSSVKDAYSDDFLTMWGRAKATAGSLLDKWGSDGELVQFNAERGRFASNVKQFFNQYRKEITGAAASEKELEQLVQSLFSEDLGPQEFKARFDEFWSKAEANLQANKDAIREGVDISGDKAPAAEAEEIIDWGNL